MNVKNKVAVVTASTKGIGLECAKTLAANGAIVYLAARNKELADNVIEEIKKETGNIAKYINFDAYNIESMNCLIDEVVKIEKRIDILVNNYGGGNPLKDKTIFDTSYDDYENILQTNIRSVFVLSQNAAKHMMKTGGGSIINISTIGSTTPDLARIGYCTSKATINSLTKNIAVHGAQFNIRCNAVLPGYIETKAAKDNMPKQFLDLFLDNTPLSRVGKPSDIASAVLYLASDESSYVTGQLIEVSGGFGMATPLYSAFIKRK